MDGMADMSKTDADLVIEWMRCMRRGDWEAAWRIGDRALRARGPGPFTHLPRHLQPVWDGRPLARRRVLVRCYHGLGDTVQFIRFAPRLKRIAREVILWAQPPLIPLLRTARGIDRLEPLHDGAPDLDYDADIELMELPHALRISSAELPGDIPYLGEGILGARRERREHRRLRAGIVWQSGVWDPRRSVPLALAERLIARAPRVEWRVLQRGPALREWRSRRARIPVVRDILDEARVLCELDVLVTVDTLSAHLAGALGVRVWTLLPARPDWRWMQAGERTPWYPSMRLWRQRPREGWAPVLERLARALEELPAAPSRSARETRMPHGDARDGRPLEVGLSPPDGLDHVVAD